MARIRRKGGGSSPEGASDGRTIGLWGAVAIGVGGMVGGGIFAVLGVVAEEAGGGAPLAFGLGGLLALLTAFSYSRLSVAFPSRGGSVVFVDRVFGIGLGTGALNNLLWFGYLITLSLYAVAFANYAETLFSSRLGSSLWLHHALISLAILVPTLLNLLSAGWIARAEMLIVGLKILMLALVAGFGITTIEVSRIAVGAWPSFAITAAAGMLVFVAYEGFELIANAGEDIESPARTLPRALFIAVGSVILIYVAVAAVTVGSLSPDQIAGSADSALARAAEPGLGRFGFLLVAVSALLATLSAINATLYGTARLSYSIAAEGELPPGLERMVWSEPPGLLITAGAALVAANTLDVTAISSIASAIFLIVFAVVNAASARLMDRVPRVLSGLGLLGCLAAIVVLIGDIARNRPMALAVLTGILLASLVGEMFWLRHRRGLQLSG